MNERNTFDSEDEKQVYEYLCSKGLQVSSQYTTDTLINHKTGYNLYFDMIIKGNGNYVLLELDGRQHFQKYNEDEQEELRNRVYRDTIKNQWAYYHMIPLVRVQLNRNLEGDSMLEYVYSLVEKVLSHNSKQLRLIDLDDNFNIHLTQEYMDGVASTVPYKNYSKVRAELARTHDEMYQFKSKDRSIVEYFKSLDTRSKQSFKLSLAVLNKYMDYMFTDEYIRNIKTIEVAESCFNKMYTEHSEYFDFLKNKYPAGKFTVLHSYSKRSSSHQKFAVKFIKFDDSVSKKEITLPKYANKWNNYLYKLLHSDDEDTCEVSLLTYIGSLKSDVSSASILVKSLTSLHDAKTLVVNTIKEYPNSFDLFKSECSKGTIKIVQRTISSGAKCYRIQLNKNLGGVNNG